MKKLTMHQKMIITAGLVRRAKELKEYIAYIEAKGQSPLFTSEFVDMELAETLDAVASLTCKRK
jgi:hypothetical protein